MVLQVEGLRQVCWLCLLLVLATLLGADTARAEWVLFDDMDTRPRTELADTASCSYRFHMIGKNAIGEKKEDFITVDYVTEEMLPAMNAKGRAPGQVFRASVPFYVALNAVTFQNYGIKQEFIDAYATQLNKPAVTVEFFRAIDGGYTIFGSNFRLPFVKDPSSMNYGDLKTDNVSLEAQCNYKNQKLSITSATASSSYSASYGADKLSNGNTYDYWIGGTDAAPFELLLDLGAVKRLDSMKIFWYPYSTNYSSSNFDIALSSDNVSFTPHQTGLNAISDIALNSKSARYVRLTLKTLVAGPFPVINEIEIYGH